MTSSCVQWVAKELAIVLPYLFDSDLQYNLRQGWRHTFHGYCDHCSWKKLNNWLQCRPSLRCCNLSVHVYQNWLEQSQKHVCNGAYHHYNYMETRLRRMITTASVIFVCLEKFAVYSGTLKTAVMLYYKYCSNWMSITHLKRIWMLKICIWH